MATLRVNIKGLDELQKKLGKQGQQALLQEISEELEIGAQELRNKAVMRAPVNTGILRAGIDVDGKGLMWIVYTVAEYAGYVEFGTRTKVKVPPEMKEEAEKFRGKKGSYTDFKEAIAIWMRQKGIPEEALFPIMAKIMNVGIEPRPFMYPSMKEVEKTLPKELDRVIQRFLDK